MIFSSLYFLFLFFPIVVLIYFLLKVFFPKNIFVRNLFLCVASLFFYSWGEPIYIFVMLLSIVANYFFAFSKKKFIFIFAIIFNLGFLIIFKYSNFILQNINSIFKINIPLLNISLPIGISFYTFQAMSYIIDVKRGNVLPQKNIFSLALYISLFPQLIAGPIVRYSDIQNQIENRIESFDKIVEGLKCFVVGLGAKVIIANNVAYCADGIYSDVANAPSFVVLLASICYMMQIYFDFYGYSKMAIGIGKIFGFDFPKNFDYPYIASNVTDFWKRWHISLSRWFRDYVYIPLGGNRCSKIANVKNLFIVWFLTGLWHGASWNFILWGLYYFVFLVIEKFFVVDSIEKIQNNFLRNLILVSQRIFTLIIVLFGWIIFRFENFSELKFVFTKIFTFEKFMYVKNAIVYFYENAAVCSKLFFLLPAILFSFPVLPKLKKLFERNIVCLCIENILVVFIFDISICMLISQTYNPFIYFRF